MIEFRERKSVRWIKVNRDSILKDTTFKVTGLHEGNIYQFRITAMNAAGDSEPSEVSMYAVCRVPTGMFPKQHNFKHVNVYITKEKMFTVLC